MKKKERVQMMANTENISIHTYNSPDKNGGMILKKAWRRMNWEIGIEKARIDREEEEEQGR